MTDFALMRCPVPGCDLHAGTPVQKTWNYTLGHGHWYGVEVLGPKCPEHDHYLEHTEEDAA